MWKNYFNLQNIKKVGRIERWEEIQGKFIVTLVFDKNLNQFADIDNVKDVAPTVLREIEQLLLLNKQNKDVEIEMVMDFYSTGYSDPGSMYGGPDHLGYPPESEDERRVKTVTVFVNGNVIGTLSPRAIKELENDYYEQIQNTEIDY